MVLSWHSITILSSVGPFTGKFTVNDSTHIVQHFYDDINPSVDLLSSPTSENASDPNNLGYIADNMFQTNFSFQGTYVNSLPFSPLITDGTTAVKWFIWYDGIENTDVYTGSVPPYTRISYKNNLGLWIDIDQAIITYNVTPVSDPGTGFGNDPLVSNVCFPAKTPILTNQGIIHIDKINPNIHTIRNKKIVAITKTVTLDKYLICFEKDSLGQNIPSEKTIISKNHQIFYKGKMIKARDFVGRVENVKKIKYMGDILYNVLMEDYEKMVVNNLIVETLHPTNIIAKLYNAFPTLDLEGKADLIKYANECACDEYRVKHDLKKSKSYAK